MYSLYLVLLPFSTPGPNSLTFDLDPPFSSLLPSFTRSRCVMTRRADKGEYTLRLDHRCRLISDTGLGTVPCVHDRTGV